MLAVSFSQVCILYIYLINTLLKSAILNWNLHGLILCGLYTAFYMNFQLITMTTLQVRYYFSHFSDKEWSLERLNFLSTFSQLINGGTGTWIWYSEPKPNDVSTMSCSDFFFMLTNNIFYNFWFFMIRK